MTNEKYIELKKSGIYKKQADILLSLNENYHKYLYLKSFNSKDEEEKRLLKTFKK